MSTMKIMSLYLFFNADNHGNGDDQDVDDHDDDILSDHNGSTSVTVSNFSLSQSLLLTRCKRFIENI